MTHTTFSVDLSLSQWFVGPEPTTSIQGPKAYKATRKGHKRKRPRRYDAVLVLGASRTSSHSHITIYRAKRYQCPVRSSAQPMSIGSVQFHSPFTVKCSSVIKTEKSNSSSTLLNFPKSQGVFNRKRNSSQRLCLGTGNGGFREISNGVGEKDGIIIVDHGSRRKESNLMLNEFVTMFREKTGYEIVEPAHMELAEPSIKNSFGKCVQQGANRVIVSPFFLFPGRHWHQDIPSLTAEAAKEHPGVPYIITAPLGLHELLVNVVNDRIKHCLSHVAGDADECAVCAGTGKCRLY